MRLTTDDLSHERTLIEAARAGCRASRAALVDHHIRLVRSVARAYARPSVPMEDLVHEGVLGLLEALERFDATRENRFSTYATYWIRERIGAFARTQAGPVRPVDTRDARTIRRGMSKARARLTQTLGREPSRDELAESLGVSRASFDETELSGQPVARALDAFGDDDPRGALACPREAPETAYARCEADALLRARVAEALAGLPARERTVAQLRFVDDEPASLVEVGVALGLSRERARQLEVKARAQLAVTLASALALAS